MSSKVTCIAPGCQSTSYDTGITFHTLPRNVETRAKWLANIGSPTRKVFERSKLCSLHFIEDSYERICQTLVGIDPKFIPAPNRLKKNAIPTLFGTTIRKRKHSSTDDLGEPSIKISVINELEAAKFEKKTLNVKHTACQVGIITSIAKIMVDQSCQTLPLRSFKNSYFNKDEFHNDYDDEANEEDKEDKLDALDISSERPEEDISRELNEDLDVMAEKKFIVFENELFQLFKVCFQCLALCSISKSVNGTCLTVRATCPNHHTFCWNSQPFIGKEPAGNILTASAISFSAVNPTKALQMLSFVGIQMFEHSTFYRIQEAYLFRAIKHVWEKEQSLILQSLSNKPLTLVGNGRMNHFGVCSKYGTYSFLENSLKKVIHIVFIQQSNQAKNNVAIEFESFIHGLKFFIQRQLNVDCMVTDRNAQISAYLMKNYRKIRHLFDCWNLVKSIKSEITEAAKSKGSEVLSEWNKSIQNHIYWVANTSFGNTELMRAKWTSLLRHIINKHDGHDAPFENCSHESINVEERSNQWLNPISHVHGKLSKIVKAYTKDIGLMSSSNQTFSVEAFHSVITHFAPKNQNYSFHELYARLILAALHFNENSVSIQAKMEDGKRRWCIFPPKVKVGELSVKPITVGSSYRYVSQLIKVACDYSVESLSEGTTKTILELKESPASLSSSSCTS